MSLYNENMTLLRFTRLSALISVVSVLSSWVVFAAKANPIILQRAVAAGVVCGVSAFLLGRLIVFPSRASRNPAGWDVNMSIPREGPGAARAQMTFLLPVLMNAAAIIVLLVTSFGPHAVGYIIEAGTVTSGIQLAIFSFCRYLARGINKT